MRGRVGPTENRADYNSQEKSTVRGRLQIYLGSFSVHVYCVTKQNEDKHTKE